MKRFLAALILTAALRAGAQTVAVLPLFNLSEDESLDWIGESVSETIREALAGEGLLVLDRETREQAYQRLLLRPRSVLTRASVVKLGELLDAERIVYGAFQVEGAGGAPGASPKDSLGLTVRVMNLRELRQGPEDSATAPLEDLADAQSRLAWRVLTRMLEPGRAPSQEQYLRNHPPVRLDALESYIRGLMSASPEQKHRFFTQAARLDERFGEPCFQLGRLQFGQKNYRVAAGWFEKVPKASSHYLEAAYFLGICRHHLADYDGAIASFEEVAAELPLNEVWNNLGAAQSRKNAPTALESFERASQGDPNDPVYLFNVGYAMWKAGRYDDAAGKFRETLDRTPEDSLAILMLGRCLNQTPPKESDLTVAGLERVKENFEEMAYRQLRAAMEPPKR